MNKYCQRVLRAGLNSLRLGRIHLPDPSRAALFIALCLGAQASVAAETAPPPEPEVSSNEPKVAAKWPDLVFDETQTIQISAADLSGLFPGVEGKPLAGIGSGQGARLRLENVCLWVAHEFVTTKTLDIRPSSNPRWIDLTIFLARPADLKDDTYKAAEAKDAIGRRIARLQRWTSSGLFGRKLPVTLQFMAAWQDGPGAKPGQPVVLRTEVNVHVISYGVTILAGLLTLFAIILAGWMAFKTRILFDTVPAKYTRSTNQVGNPPKVEDFWRWQFSLSRVQGFGWMFLVFFGTVFVYATTGSLLGVINPTALGLLAIGGGTTFVGLLLDQSRDAQNTPGALNQMHQNVGGVTQAPPPQNAALAAALEPPSVDKIERPSWRYLLSDILESYSAGNLHRLQTVTWTVALMAIYLHRLLTTFALPEFDGTLFGLMGISSATYLAFKDRETPKK